VRILLTGADGFTGRHFLNHAKSLGHEVVALKADLTDLEAVFSEVQAVRPSHVLHLAAISAVTHADEEAFYRVNLFGTQNLLKALCALPDGPLKVLLASSANIYGNALESPISESYCPKPVNHYALSKLAMELMSTSFMQRLPIVIARPFNYTGVWHDNRFVVPKIVEHFQQRASEIELGNLEVLREYNDVRMVCKAYIDLLALGVAGETYNIASGRAVALKTIISTLEEITSHTMIVRVNQAFIRPNEITILSGSSQKIESLLGPLKHPSLKDTLSWMLDSKLS
jgi:nucleoside-diphosphate-sugar epimerase